MPDCDECIVPPLFLQPLVENAVKHGIAGLVDGGTIRLEAHCEDGWLQLTVQNEFDPEAPAGAAAWAGTAEMSATACARCTKTRPGIDTVVTATACSW